MAPTADDPYRELHDARREARRQRDVADVAHAMGRRLAARVADLTAENARLRGEVGRLRALVGAGHAWGREAASQVYRCKDCGMRTTAPLDVALDCAGYRASLNRRRGKTTHE